MFWNAKNGTVSIDNAEISYVSFGYGNKALIILLGLSDGIITVKGKALLLAKPYKIFFEKYTVYIFSRRKNLPEEYSIKEMADDQAKAMQKLGIKKASVMGVSQGGMIAQHLAVDHAEMIEKLVLAVSAPRANKMIQTNISKWIEFANQGNHKQLMIDVIEKNYSPKYLAKYRKLYPVIGMIGKPSNYKRFLTNANAILQFDILHDLKNITCPTLIVGGEEDRVVGIQSSCEMNEQIAGSELYVYAGLGHAAFQEAKDFTKRVFDFLEPTLETTL
ncbi:MAG: alpha/beta hydrolase [Clostridiaceae bacterium]|jgi:pimeloyl-ACP methyl ester carboxylesterase|nr:alpha/beta hydrolase [Clostridiaceae bacterium]